MVTKEILDVTQIEPRFKHPTIFKHFDELEAGESFIIDNDHDPKPLYYQLLGERGNIFSWKYLMEGPQRWQVKIGKNNSSKNGAALTERELHKAAFFKEKGDELSCGCNDQGL